MHVIKQLEAQKEKKKRRKEEKHEVQLVQLWKTSAGLDLKSMVSGNKIWFHCLCGVFLQNLVIVLIKKENNILDLAINVNPDRVEDRLNYKDELNFRKRGTEGGRGLIKI